MVIKDKLNSNVLHGSNSVTSRTVLISNCLHWFCANSHFLHATTFGSILALIFPHAPPAVGATSSSWQVPPWILPAFAGAFWTSWGPSGNTGASWSRYHERNPRQYLRCLPDAAASRHKYSSADLYFLWYGSNDAAERLEAVSPCACVPRVPSPQQLVRPPMFAP